MASGIGRIMLDKQYVDKTLLVQIHSYLNRIKDRINDADHLDEGEKSIELKDIFEKIEVVFDEDRSIGIDNNLLKDKIMGSWIDYNESYYNNSSIKNQYIQNTWVDGYGNSAILGNQEVPF